MTHDEPRDWKPMEMFTQGHKSDTQQLLEALAGIEANTGRIADTLIDVLDFLKEEREDRESREGDPGEEWGSAA